MDALEWLTYAKLIMAFTPNSKQFSLYYGVIHRSTKFKPTKVYQRFKKIINYSIWFFWSFFHFLHSNVPDIKCHKQKWRVLFFTRTKPVACVLACARAIARIKRKRLVMKQEFETFPKTCSQGLQICSHSDGIHTLTGLLNDLVAADREGNLEGHLHVIQILLLFFNVR